MLAYQNLARVFFINNGSRNDGIILVLGCFPDRVLKHRGWTKEKLIYVRELTESEKAFVARATRYQAFRYESVDDFLSEEREVLDEEQFKEESEVLKNVVR